MTGSDIDVDLVDLFSHKRDARNGIAAARAPDGSVLIACRTNGVNAGAWLTREQAAALGLELLGADLGAVARLSALAGDPQAVVELGLALLEPHSALLSAEGHA